MKSKNVNKNTTIAVAMSGGVDSSVVVALLKKQGYSVRGFFMKNWSDTTGLKYSDCPWLQDREDAMRVAAKLDIPFETLDFEKEYKSQVLDYFFSEYKAGHTPNPDIMCNAKIKFGVLLDKALELGADYLATGHYARLKCHSKDRNGGYDLLKAVDQNKDQTYFLHRLDQKQLSKAMFPLGEYKKEQVRKLAKKFGLPNSAKKDSQGVCFIGHIDLQKFLSQKIKKNPGNIVNLNGEKIGEHNGLFWYTIGQRKGIGVGGVGPFYVVKKDFKKNELIVSSNPKNPQLYADEVEVKNLNWIFGNAPAKLFKCQAKIRYREKLSSCVIIKKTAKKYLVRFSKKQWAISSGQSVVFYKGQKCLGGGIVAKKNPS